MSDYDKELINSRIIEVCDYYLPGEGRREGQKRRIWPCPVCGSDSFSANDQRGYAGCFSSCDMPRANDAVAIIAYFEDLELKGEQFVRCLQKGYEILAIPEPEDDASSKRNGNHRPRQPDHKTSHSASGETPSDKEANAPVGTAAVLKEPDTTPEDHSPDEAPAMNAESTGEPEPKEKTSATRDSQEHRELVNMIYRAFLELCPLIDRDVEFWLSRGVTEETMTEGGFGSVWREHCHQVLPELESRFGRNELISVPGFYQSDQGRLQTNLYDDYTLIPYHDRDGYITTVEGRVPGQPREGKPKYMAPVNSGLHLYVYPRYRPEQTMAFVEGAVGAIVAAQSGIPVASIKGYQHYRISGGKGESDRPLPEHENTVFDGRRVLYIMDEDVKPQTRESVQAEAPKAARALIEEHGGKPLIARLPEGYKDLDEWLLSVDEVERVPQFAGLMPRAVTPDQWEGKEDPTKTEPQQIEQNQGTDRGHYNREESSGDPGRVHQSKERTGTSGSSQQDGSSKEEDSGDEGEEEPPAPAVKTRQPQPRSYRPIAKTNFGEFMVALFYGFIAGVALLMVMVYAAPQWGPTSVVPAVPVWISVFSSAAVAIAVLVLVCRRLYVRRWRSLRDHLAGKR